MELSSLLLFLSLRSNTRFHQTSTDWTPELHSMISTFGSPISTRLSTATSGYSHNNSFLHLPWDFRSLVLCDPSSILLLGWLLSTCHWMIEWTLCLLHWNSNATTRTSPSLRHQSSVLPPSSLNDMVKRTSLPLLWRELLLSSLLVYACPVESWIQSSRVEDFGWSPGQIIAIAALDRNEDAEEGTINHQTMFEEAALKWSLWLNEEGIQSFNYR